MIPYALKLVPSNFPVVTEGTPLQEESESGSLVVRTTY